ncbi:MAG: CAP domain-containing protein [Gaiellaceae bacterium]
MATCAIGAVLFCLLLIPVASSAPSRARVTSVSSLNSQVVREVNRVRAQHGLKPLVRSSALTRAAANHSRSMATDGYFAHESANGSVFWQRIKNYYPSSGHSYWAVGENLVWASPNLTAKRAVKMWMNSPPHRANVLSAKWREIGLSAVYSPDAPGSYQDLAATILTADFGVRR